MAIFIGLTEIHEINGENEYELDGEYHVVDRRRAMEEDSREIPPTKWYIDVEERECYLDATEIVLIQQVEYDNIRATRGERVWFTSIFLRDSAYVTVKETPGTLLNVLARIQENENGGDDEADDIS